MASRITLTCVVVALAVIVLDADLGVASASASEGVVVGDAGQDLPVTPPAPAPAPARVTIAVDRGQVLNTFEATFVSVTHDIQDFIGYNIAPWSFDWTNPQLRNLLAALTPMTLRCGGTWEDGIFWSDGPKTGRYNLTKPSMQPHELNASVWDPFARSLNAIDGRVDLVVGLGALWRHWGECQAAPQTSCPSPIPWDGSNAAAFIRHNRAQGHNIYGYELGNEPAVWTFTWGTPIVTPEQHAKDYAALRSLLGNGTNNERVVGPDTTWGPVGDEKPDGTGRNPMGIQYDYWNDTLQQQPDIDIAAFHYYAIQPGLGALLMPMFIPTLILTLTLIIILVLVLILILSARLERFCEYCAEWVHVFCRGSACKRLGRQPSRGQAYVAG